MIKHLRNWIDLMLRQAGMDSAATDGLDRWILFVGLILLTILFDWICRKTLVRGIRRIVEHTSVKWDDEIFSLAVLNHFCHILSTLLLMVFLPVVFADHPVAREVVMRLARSCAVVAVFSFVNALFNSVFLIAVRRPAWQDKPINGLRQTGQGIALLICVILIISILIDISPKILLTGLGASAAIVLLIFKDSILGFVSGIQLAANDMLKVNDWIQMPKYGVDGTVTEVTLTTVKVRNFDNTIVTLPPYLLVSDSFQNWQAMKNSGGRRVMRSISIDMTSVKFCTCEMLARYRRIDLVRDYIDEAEARLEEYNLRHNVGRGERRINGRQQTNLGIFRAYLMRYLHDEGRVNLDMQVMVRQLQPTDTGLPLQLYFFTNTVIWDEYESIQSDVFDHVLAVISVFDLRVFQNPSGVDFLALKDHIGREIRHRENAGTEHPGGESPASTSVQARSSRNKASTSSVSPLIP